MQTRTTDSFTIQKSEFSSLLREVACEELICFAAQEAEWNIEEGSILWEDLTALQADHRAGTLKLLSHAEVFGK